MVYLTVGELAEWIVEGFLISVVGFQIVIAKFCTPDNTALFDKHLECLEKRG
jgi:hypothetical protein